MSRVAAACYTFETEFRQLKLLKLDFVNTDHLSQLDDRPDSVSAELTTQDAARTPVLELEFFGLHFFSQRREEQQSAQHHNGW